MKLKLVMVIVLGLLMIGMTLAFDGYVQQSTQGTPGSGLLYRNGRVAVYQNPNAFYGSGVYQKRTTQRGPAYNPFPMPNTPASGRDGRYSSYIYLDNPLAAEIYSNRSLLQPRYMTNNQRFLTAYPYTHGFYGPASRRDKRAPLLDVSSSDKRNYGNVMGYKI